MSELLRVLSARTGLIESDLRRIVQTAPMRYKVFDIPKRSGGTREIAQPARELKALQRAFIEEFRERMPIHEAARAYREGFSIRDNAAPHAGAGPILKMDFRDFFPSIRSEDWEAYCDRLGLLDAADRRLSSQVLFRRAKGERVLKLSIGAPSSPLLSNALLFEFDALVFGEAERRKINYTRYADDMTFSGQRIGLLNDMLKVVERSAKQIKSPRLIVNHEKTAFVTGKNRRMVTGVLLSNQGGLSLGRERKRLISAAVHHAMLGKLDGDSLADLAGQLSFANVVEPEFLQKLRDKYGPETVARIQKSASLRGNAAQATD